MFSKNWLKVLLLFTISSNSPTAVGKEPDFDTPPERVAEFKEKALKGDPVAQYDLAWLTVLGWAGVAKDEERGRALFIQSAELGYDEAQVHVAGYYMSPEYNGKIDLPSAAFWLNKAAKQGNKVACFYLANLYQDGSDSFRFILELEKKGTVKFEQISKNEAKSKDLWRQYGLSKTEIDSLCDLHTRIAKGDWRAHKDVAEMLREHRPKKLIIEPYSEVHLLKYARHLFDHNLKEALSGNIRAMMEVAQNYRRPSCPGHPEKNGSEELKWLNKAAQSGSLEALYELGRFYSQTEEWKDLRKSFDFFKQAADKGHPQAMCSVALMYEAKEDLQESTRWMIKAAEAGDSASWFYLAHRYQNGKGVPVNFVKAYAWFSISSSDEKEGSDTAARRRLKDLAGRMPPEKIVEAQQLAAQIWDKLEKKISPNSKLSAAEKLNAQVLLDLERNKLGSPQSK